MSTLTARVEYLQDNGLRLLGAYVLLCAFIFALQIFPIPGFFLTMLAGPLWIGLVVHVAMLHFAWLAISRAISRAWLALPLCFYAGGFALHLVSIHAAEVQAAAINAHNASVRLTIEQPLRFLREGGDSFPLIEHYRVDRTFQRRGKRFEMTYYARGADCDDAHQDYNYQRRNEPWLFRRDIFAYYRGNKTRQCLLSQEVASADWRYRITGRSTSENDHISSLYARYGTVFEILDDREKRTLGTIEVARFSTFPTVPFLVAGCGLNSKVPSWECAWGLTKSNADITGGYKLRAADDPQDNPFIPSLDPDTWEVTALARALGLEARQPTD